MNILGIRALSSRKKKWQHPAKSCILATKPKYVLKRFHLDFRSELEFHLFDEEKDTGATRGTRHTGTEIRNAFIESATLNYILNEQAAEALVEVSTSFL